MKVFGNILWFLLGGLIISLFYYLSAMVLFVTVIGIPFAVQLVKIGTLMLWPFEKEVLTDFEKHPILNIIWIILGGITTPMFHLIFGGLLYITIIGIPFAKQHFKLAKATFLPFGLIIRKA